MKSWLGMALILGVVVSISGAVHDSAKALQGDWTAIRKTASVYLRLYSKGTQSGFTVSPKELIGLSEEQINGESSTVQFQIRKDSGAIHMSGIFHKGKGAGEFRFEPSAGYADEVARLGTRRPQDEELLQMCIHDVSLDFIRGLHARGYRKLDPEDFMELCIHDVTLETIDALAKLGYSGVPKDRLVEMSIHDVTPELIGELQTLGYRNLRTESLVEMSIHDVTPEFIRELKELGYDPLSADDLVAMSIHDVTPDFVRDLRQLGYTAIAADDLVAMRIHDVTPDFIRRANSSGRRLSVDRLVQMRIHE